MPDYEPPASTALALYLECPRGHRMPYAAGDQLIGRNTWGEHAGTNWWLAKSCPWCADIGRNEAMTLMRGNRPETGLPRATSAPPTKQEAPPDES